MNKSTYIFTCFLLSVQFWNISFFQNLHTENIILLLTLLWAVSSFFIFSQDLEETSTFKVKYINYALYILVGVFISMFSAYIFWGQNFLITLVSQRFMYNFILLPAVLFVQPKEKEIIKALKWISIATIIVWWLNVFFPSFVSSDDYAPSEENTNIFDIGSYVLGIHFVILFLYYKIQDYITDFSWSSFIQVSLLLVFLLLYHNRSMLIGVIPVLGYSLLILKSKYKTVIIFFMFLILTMGVIYSWNIWESLFNQTIIELNNPDYARWKALFYYFKEYSPSWFCYIFGNGMPSIGNSKLGDTTLTDMGREIYASDLGMIGMWTTYGLIPLIAIYSVIFRILNGSIFPLYLKFFCFHILLVPTIFHFWTNPGIFMFVIIIYLYSFHNEQNKFLPNNTGKAFKRVCFEYSNYPEKECQKT